MEKGRDDGKLLLHAVGICADGLAECIGQVEPLAVNAGALRPCGIADPIDIRDKIKVLDAGHVLIKLWVIRQIGQFLLCLKWFLLHRNSIHQNLAAVRLQDAAAAFQRRGFARTIRAEKPIDFSRLDGQGQAIHGSLGPIVLGQLFDLEHRKSSSCRHSLLFSSNHLTFLFFCQAKRLFPEK